MVIPGLLTFSLSFPAVDHASPCGPFRVKTSDQHLRIPSLNTDLVFFTLAADLLDFKHLVWYVYHASFSLPSRSVHH